MTGVSGNARSPARRQHKGLPGGAAGAMDRIAADTVVRTMQVPGLGEAAAAAVELDLSPSYGGSSGGSTSSSCVQAQLHAK